jgi:hypothetical protein
MAHADTRSVPFTLLGALALAVAGCGSSSSTSSTTTPASAKQASGAVAPTLPPSGKYVAKLTTAALAAVGVDTLNVGGGGLWHLSISPSKMTLTPPRPAEPDSYRVVALTKNRLTLAGNPLCSVLSGQKNKSVYTISTSPQGLRFVGVKIACKEDGGSLTAGRWTKP